MQRRSEHTTQTLERGLDLLLVFSESNPLLSAAQLAEQSGLPLSTVYRLLQTLEARGFVTPGGGGRYQLGPSILAMVPVLRRRLDQGIGGVALPIMEELAATTGETVILTVCSNSLAVCIQSVESDQALRLSFRRGVINPLWCGASAKVLLAYLDRETQVAVIEQAVGQSYANGIRVEAEALVGQLIAIRANGYACTSDEVDRGVRAVAVPVLQAGRQLLAGLSVAAPHARLEVSAVPALAAQLTSAAARITARMDLHDF
jgi:DNA-binding IclR family transcriptional regulator